MKSPPGEGGSILSLWPRLTESQAVVTVLLTITAESRSFRDMPKHRQYGSDATRMLADQARTLPRRAQRHIDTYPHYYIDWLREAALVGTLIITVPPGEGSPHGLVLALRRFCRALVDQNHPAAATAAALQVLAPKGREVTIIRHDARLSTYTTRAVETKYVPTVGEVAKNEVK